MHVSCAGARLNRLDVIGTGAAGISGILAVVTALTMLETQSRLSPEQQATGVVNDQAEGLFCVHHHAWNTWTGLLP